jgi:hypothetical protein
LSEALAAARPADLVTLTVSRGAAGQAQGTTQDLTVHVTLGELPGS